MADVIDLNKYKEQKEKKMEDHPDDEDVPEEVKLIIQDVISGMPHEEIIEKYGLEILFIDLGLGGTDLEGHSTEEE